jgi:hypothetical protein
MASATTPTSCYGRGKDARRGVEARQTILAIAEVWR